MRWILTAVLLLPTLAHAKKFHVIVDPGHGGIDSGAARNGVREADIALAVGKKLAQLLRADSRFRVSMTRTSNRKTELKERADFANSRRADLFVSVHANASMDIRAKGAEFYLQNHLKPTEESMFLAAREEEADGSGTEEMPTVAFDEFDTDSKEVLTILDDLVRTQRIIKSDRFATSLARTWKKTGLTKRTAIRQAPFYLVSNVLMPSVLVELGYLSNRLESRRLSSSTYQAKMAQSLYRGIVRFQERMDK